MKVSEEITAYEYYNRAWSGAKDTLRYLEFEEIEQIFSILEDIYPDGMDITALNDFFWFETETIAEWLGYPSFDNIINSRDEREW